MIAGGVGINPIMSMLSQAGSVAAGPSEQPAVRFSVAYASRVPDQGIGKILFLDRITELLRGGRIRGSLSLFLTGQGVLSDGDCRPWEEQGHQLYRRRIAQQDLESLVSNPRRTVVYICGPPVMTDELQAFLTSPEGLGMDTAQVIIEKWW